MLKDLCGNIYRMTPHLGSAVNLSTSVTGPYKDQNLENHPLDAIDEDLEDLAGPPQGTRVPKMIPRSMTSSTAVEKLSILAESLRSNWIKSWNKKRLSEGEKCTPDYTELFEFGTTEAGSGFNEEGKSL